MAVRRLQKEKTKEYVEVVNRHGLVKGAVKLGVSQSTLCTFLKNAGFRRTAQYVKVAAPQQN